MESWNCRSSFGARSKSLGETCVDRIACLSIVIEEDNDDTACHMYLLYGSVQSEGLLGTIRWRVSPMHSEMTRYTHALVAASTPGRGPVRSRVPRVQFCGDAPSVSRLVCVYQSELLWRNSHGAVDVYS